MLTHLTIRNYALIENLEMSPSSGLSVITGETGAGKSIMLGAIGLLMGNRADTKVLWKEDEKCIAEGVFDIRAYKLKTVFKNLDLDFEDQTVIRREISPNGKSRAFVNDTPVTLDVLKQVGNMLMDIHSQHETLLLGSQSFQLNLVDSYGGNQSLREEYAAAWQNFLDTKKAFDDLTSQAETLRQEADYVNFQLEELIKVSLEENEQEALESELKVMEHAEEIKIKLQAAVDLLNRSEFSSRSSIAGARAQLQQLTSFSTSYENIFNRLESVRIELDDIISEIEISEEKIEFNPERTEFVKERLSVIYRLQKKHRVNNIKELLSIQSDLQRKASITSNLEEALSKSKEKFEVARMTLIHLAEKLTERRKKVFSPLVKEITSLLKELGIPEAQVKIDLNVIAPGTSGADSIEMLFSANKGIPPRALAQVASGGEFSRLMFCVKYILAEKTSMPTLILDEIDNGVSGEIAIKLGTLMKAMAKKHQLIAITHLPQIAAKGDGHYFVYKDNSADVTVSNIRLLNEQERVNEIAQMIGGARPSAITLQGAKELLSQ